MARERRSGDGGPPGTGWLERKRNLVAIHDKADLKRLDDPKGIKLETIRMLKNDTRVRSRNSRKVNSCRQPIRATCYGMPPSRTFPGKVHLCTVAIPSAKSNLPRLDLFIIAILRISRATTSSDSRCRCIVGTASVWCWSVGYRTSSRCRGIKSISRQWD